MDHLTTHVCGALPVTQLLMMVTRCHHHEAWTVDASVRHQYTAEPVELAQAIIEFGPFDDLDTVGRAIARILRDQLSVLRDCTTPSREHPETR